SGATVDVENVAITGAITANVTLEAFIVANQTSGTITAKNNVITLTSTSTSGILYGLDLRGQVTVVESGNTINLTVQSANTAAGINGATGATRLVASNVITVTQSGVALTSAASIDG